MANETPWTHWLTENRISIVIGAIALFVAWLQLRAAKSKGLPGVVAETAGSNITLRNVGDATAMGVCLSDEKSAQAWRVGDMAVGDVRPAPTLLNVNNRYRLFYRSGTHSRGVWYQSIFLVERLVGNSPIVVRNAPARRRILPLPKVVRRELDTRDIVTQLVRLSRPWDPRNWPHMLRPRWLALVTKLWRAYYIDHEIQYFSEFLARPRQFPVFDQPAHIRNDWKVDLRGIISCRKSPIGILYHYGVETLPDGELIAEVGLDNQILNGRLEPLRGIVRIRRKTLDQMSHIARAQRDTELFKRLTVEFCRRKPASDFLIVL